MKNSTIIVSIVLVCLAFYVSASALTIDGGTDVGGIDTLLDQTKLDKSDEKVEKAWVEGVLGFEVTISYELSDSEESDWTGIDLLGGGVSDTIWAHELGHTAEYYFLKMGNLKIFPTNFTHYLFNNLLDLSYAVIDLTEFGAEAKDINIGKVSHLSGFGSPVPEPATMILFGFGLLGLAGIGRKKSKK